MGQPLWDGRASSRTSSTRRAISISLTPCPWRHRAWRVLRGRVDVLDVRLDPIKTPPTSHTVLFMPPTDDVKEQLRDACSPVRGIPARVRQPAPRRWASSPPCRRACSPVTAGGRRGPVTRATGRGACPTRLPLWGLEGRCPAGCCLLPIAASPLLRAAARFVLAAVCCVLRCAPSSPTPLASFCLLLLLPPASRVGAVCSAGAD